MQFSANLGFLWKELPLPDAIAAAASAGFTAVECHWPYDTPPDDVRAALDDTGLPMLGLNTRRGKPGENGLCALPGREKEARAAIDEALDYGRAINAGAIHVMAGIAEGPEAERIYCENLRYACEAAARHDITILIEPLNRRDAPGYFLRDSTQAARLIGEIGHEALRLMFDCYHVQITEGDLSRRFERLLPMIGHIQIAAVPDRGPPDHGEVDYGFLLDRIKALGWVRPVGAEYQPGGPTGETLGWMRRFAGLSQSNSSKSG